ncbi:MAG: PhnB protein [Gemmataceae bacterium]|nr:PhnB protein [Gemmataceae bacterium]
MQYMILIYGDEKGHTGRSEADMQQEYAQWMQYSKEMAESGAMKGGASLKPIATATTVRVRNGKVATTDGPFAETKEQLGGYYLIDVPTLDDAIKWAAKCPGAIYGSIEVRPLGIISAPDGSVAATQ